MTTDSPPSPSARIAYAWRVNLPPERRVRTNLRGGLIFGRSALLYVLLFCGAFLLPAGSMKASCLAMMPFVIGALFVIGHDAAHHSLMRSRRLNQIVGSLALLPAYHPFTSWSYAHNVLHHGGTCLKTRQPDFPPFSMDEFARLPRWRQRLERIYRSPLGIGLCYTLDFYPRFLLFPLRAGAPIPRPRFYRDLVLVLGFLGLQLWAGYQLSAIGSSAWLPRPAYVAAAVIGPWLAWIYFMGVASFVQHTHPRTAWFADEAEWSFYEVQLRSSTHMKLPRPLEWILHSIMDHPAHHIDPTIPLYELAASQKLLEQQAPEDSVVVRLTWREYLRICRMCKLYDYRRHCWLDFEGHPTSARLLPS